MYRLLGRASQTMATRYFADKAKAAGLSLTDYGDEAYWDMRYAALESDGAYEWACQPAGPHFAKLLALVGVDTPSDKPPEILELGCGSSLLGKALSEHGFRVTAVDFSAEVIARQREADPDHRINFVCADVTNLTSMLNGATFDAIVSKSLLDTLGTRKDKVEAIAATFEGAHAALRSGGRIVFVDFGDHHFLRQYNPRRSQLFEMLTDSEPVDANSPRHLYIDALKRLSKCEGERVASDHAVAMPASWSFKLHEGHLLANIALLDVESSGGITLEVSCRELRVRTGTGRPWLVATLPPGSLVASAATWSCRRRVLVVTIHGCAVAVDQGQWKVRDRTT